MILFRAWNFLRHNGLALTVRELCHRFANKVFNFTLVLGRTDMNIDRSARILGFSHIKIGKNFSAGKDLWLEAVLTHGNTRYNPSLVIKDQVSVRDFVHIGAVRYVEIGENVLMGSHIFISDHNHGSYSGDHQSDPREVPNGRKVKGDQEVVIGGNVWIGDHVCILPGVRIGSGSVIGAGSVVTKNIPEACVAVGNPAKVIKRYNPNSRKWKKV